MTLTDEKLKEILSQEHYVTDEDLARASAQAATAHHSLTTELHAEGLITPALLGQAAAEFYKLPYADLATEEPSREQVLAIPEEIARKERTILFKQTPQEAIIATDDPEAVDQKALQPLFPNKTIHLAYALTQDIDAAFSHYRKSLETRFAKIIEGKDRVAPEILDQILSDAFALRASDVHFEPQKVDILIRFRIDGVLAEAGRIPRDRYENVLNRIKVQSRLRIDEHFATQDGSMQFEKEGAVLDIRTSIAPTVEGEKVVLRVLAAYLQGFTLSDVGLSPMHEKLLRAAAERPFGMILISGPTGSGKTTTLYTLLRLLNQPDTNIVTIEDPVEYKVQGINQIQVNLATKLTFAKGLNAILRQDPDVILVGEIRDAETADIAVNAALTGHLLLSTFHANDAATAIPRLLEMNIEPFLLASTINIMVAQRLVRKICSNCKQSVTVSKESSPLNPIVFERYFGKTEATLYSGKGCAACGDTGYRGRIAIFEMIQVTPQLQDLVLTSPSARAIRTLARKEGGTVLFEDGVEKVKQGITTIEELSRVVEPPADE